MNWIEKGDDDVAVCVVNSDGSVKLNHYYNMDHSPVLLSSSNSAIGFSNIVTSYSNGIAKCSFTRLKALPNVSQYFDLNSKYYILTASGAYSSSSGKTSVRLLALLKKLERSNSVLF